MSEQWAQDAGQQDQAEQGLAQQEHDDDLRRILRRVVSMSIVCGPDFPFFMQDLKTLCSACGIDVRDVT